jgi:hypothetical protein
MIKMYSNLAELISVDIDTSILASEWQSYKDENRNSINWKFRVFLEYDVLPDFLKSLADKIYDIIKKHPKNFILQVYDKELFDHKKFLDIVHKDVDRQTCITIPVLYNTIEPIVFYNDNPDIQPESYKTLNKPWPDKPIQKACYSKNHPTLVNLQTLHNVRIFDDSPRILFQLSYDIGYASMIDENPSIWRYV